MSGAQQGPKVQERNKSKGILKAPLRALTKARDSYEKFMVDCAARFDQNTMYGCTAPQVPQRPLNSRLINPSKAIRSQNVIKVVSNRKGWEVESDDGEGQFEGQQVAVGVAGMGIRSYSVGVGKIGRIDEEKPCDFVEVGIFPRSRSAYAVIKTM